MRTHGQHFHLIPKTLLPNRFTNSLQSLVDVVGPSKMSLEGARVLHDPVADMTFHLLVLTVHSSNMSSACDFFRESSATLGAYKLVVSLPYLLFHV